MSTEERVSYRDKLAEALRGALRQWDADELPGWKWDALADVILPTITCGASDTGLIPDTTLGPCILRVDHDGPVHEDGNGVRWSLGGAVRDAELDRLSQENDRLAAELVVAQRKRDHHNEVANAALRAALGQPPPKEMQMADLRDLITAIIRRHLGSPPDLNMFPHASDALADAIAGGLEPVMDELTEERDAARRAREVLPSLKDQLLDLVEVRPALAATLSVTYRDLAAALGRPPAEKEEDPNGP